MAWVTVSGVEPLTNWDRIPRWGAGGGVKFEGAPGSGIGWLSAAPSAGAVGAGSGTAASDVRTGMEWNGNGMEWGHP